MVNVVRERCVRRFKKPINDIPDRFSIWIVKAVVNKIKFSRLQILFDIGI